MNNSENESMGDFDEIEKSLKFDNEKAALIKQQRELRLSTVKHLNESKEFHERKIEFFKKYEKELTKTNVTRQIENCREKIENIKKEIMIINIRIEERPGIF